jgi:hypothetical protein
MSFMIDVIMDVIEVMSLRRIRFVEHVWEIEECIQNFS